MHRLVFHCFIDPPNQARRDAATSGVYPADSGNPVELSTVPSGIGLTGVGTDRSIGVHATICSRCVTTNYVAFYSILKWAI